MGLNLRPVRSNLRSKADVTIHSRSISFRRTSSQGIERLAAGETFEQGFLSVTGESVAGAERAFIVELRKVERAPNSGLKSFGRFQIRESA
jgi:hypothetical protein